VTQEDLTRKKEIILNRESVFANEIGSVLFEKPKASYWLIFIPFLFLYFIYRMQKYKKDRIKFSQEFMSARREAMDIALDASMSDGSREMNLSNRYEKLPEPLQKPYMLWIKTLSSFYFDLLASEGDDFDAFVRRAYRKKAGYLEALDKLNNAEKEFYSVLKPLMVGVEGAGTVIGRIESESRRLHTESANRIFN
jgi:hypothetical protein